jgi:hypothetical protein
MTSRKLHLAACALAWLLTAPGRAETTADLFYAPPPDTGARLPVEGIFPQGRKLAFMGYSGVPARDLTNGFTVAGPVYGDQLPYLARCASNGWPVVAHVGLRVKFADSKAGAGSKAGPALSPVKRAVREQIQALAGFQQIAWWAVTPEELRPWRSAEMDYLKDACDAIRESDPNHRPVYLYNPNHRNEQTLAPIARQVDIVAKGTYVNSTGRKQERAWVRWSVEQEIAAIRSAGRPGALPLLNPELCADPEPAEDCRIRGWVRHDVYLGLASGAKGVLIWSLYPRKAVHRSWQLWYDAYAECGRELNGPRGLAQVFLFGDRRSDLKVDLVEGKATVPMTLGGNIEAGTTSEQERAKRQIQVPAWTAAEFAYGDSRWLFLVNSANTPGKFVISGWPAGSRAEDAFTGTAVALTDASGLPVSLPGNGVRAIRFSQAR